MGFGPINPEADEPVFHADWERRALGLTLCAGAVGGWTLDRSRHLREKRHPADYYGSSYYEIWIKGLEALLTEAGLLGDDATGEPRGRVLTADRVPTALRRGGPTEREVDQPPRFAPGDRVRTVNHHRPTHTRLPRYAAGRVGTVESVNGAHVFPDTNAHGEGEQPHWLYTVTFDGRELWGDGADTGLVVSIDAWEPYLEPEGTTKR